MVGDAKTSGRIYVPKELIGRKVVVGVIPKDDVENSSEIMTLEGKVEIDEWEGGYAASSMSIGDVEDFVNGFVEKFGNAEENGRYGYPDQKIEGKFRITVEKIE